MLHFAKEGNQRRATKTKRHTMPLHTTYLFDFSSRLLAFTLLCIILTACDTSNPNTQPQVQAPIPPTKYIGEFSRIPGTLFLRAPIVETSTGTSGFSLSSPSYTSEFAHNYIYLNTQTEQTLQLLPDNTMVILENTGFPERQQDSTDGWVIEWFLYSIVKADTNNDDRLNNNDTKTLAISDSGGRGYTELIDGVVEVHGHTLRDPQTLLVIYRKDGKLF